MWLWLFVLKFPINASSATCWPNFQQMKVALPGGQISNARIVIIVKEVITVKEVIIFTEVKIIENSQRSENSWRSENNQKSENSLKSDLKRYLMTFRLWQCLIFLQRGGVEDPLVGLGWRSNWSSSSEQILNQCNGQERGDKRFKSWMNIKRNYFHEKNLYLKLLRAKFRKIVPEKRK